MMGSCDALKLTLIETTFRYNEEYHFPELTVLRHHAATSEWKCNSKEALRFLIPNEVTILPATPSESFQLRVLCKTDDAVAAVKGLRREYAQKHKEALQKGGTDELSQPSMIMLFCKLLAGHCQCEDCDQKMGRQAPTVSYQRSYVQAGTEGQQEPRQEPHSSNFTSEPMYIHGNRWTFVPNQSCRVTANLKRKIKVPFNGMDSGHNTPKRMDPRGSRLRSRGVGGSYPQGYIYLVASPSKPNLLKIGFSSFPPQRRFHSLLPCFPDAVLLAQTSSLPHARRAEQLIHTELGRQRRRQDCLKCDKEHQEWFEVTEDLALDVMDTWGRWMTRRPYHKTGALKTAWKRSLKYLGQEEPANGHDLHQICKTWTREQSFHDPMDRSEFFEIHRHGPDFD